MPAHGEENEIGRLPTRNHKKGVFDLVEKVGSTRIRDEFRVAKNSCFNCLNLLLFVFSP